MDDMYYKVNIVCVHVIEYFISNNDDSIQSNDQELKGNASSSTRYDHYDQPIIFYN